MSFADILNMGLEQYADIGFALLVGGVCIRTLLFDREANIKQRAIWKQELKELEKSLRILIDEATEASHVFDKQLGKRQIAIEKMADRAENLLRASISNANKPATSQKNTATKRSDSQKTTQSKKIKDWTMDEDLPNHLMSSLESASDRASFNSENAKSNNEESELAAKKALSDERIFAQTSIVDPVAFKIAKRLLLEGKELHVIARKLDMPVSEIRHLETLIRQQAQLDQAELPETFKSKDLGTVSKIIRDPAERKTKSNSVLLDQVEAISSSRSSLDLSFEDDLDLPLTLNR